MIVRDVIEIPRLAGGCYSVVRLVLTRFGMLPLSRTGIDWVSEDCLPEEEIEGIGATLGEFEILGYGENRMAYYIRCPDCVSIFKKPKTEDEKIWVKGWEEEFIAVEKQLGSEMQEVKTEMVDLTADTQVKMEFSRSTATTMTTQPEGYESDGFYQVVRDLHVGREVILID